VAGGLSAAVLATVGLLIAAPAFAGDADVVDAKVVHRSGRVFDFDVTVRSRDTGWERYADQIEVLGPDGKVLGTRVLVHPHEDEQPFTRDVYGVTIPGGVEAVTVRARFKPSGFDGATLRVVLPR
jgi:hypothetical protein